MWDATALVATTRAPEPALVCRAFFLLAGAACLAIAAAPDVLSRQVLDYGARMSTADGSGAGSHRQNGKSKGRGERMEDTAGRGAGASAGAGAHVVGRLTSVGQVPHAWFVHFYTASLACSAFWALQYLAGGRVLGWVVGRQAATAAGVGTGPSSMSLGQVVVAWCMMLLQAARRFYECCFVMRPSGSTMWIVHWLLGMAFYFTMGVAVWVEGSPSIANPASRALAVQLPLLKTVTGLALYLCACVMQHRCHRVLAGLRKYSLPETGMFRHLVCPHYTCECLVYLSLAVAAAPGGQAFNKTLLCALAFVGVNLGVTANGTKAWYVEKFGREKAGRKWKMVPFVF